MTTQVLICRFGGLICLLMGIAGAFAIATGLSATVGISLTGTPKCVQCHSPTDLMLFASQSHWSAIVVLESVVATFAVAMSIVSVWQAVESWRPSTNAGVFACLAIGVPALAWDVHQIWLMREPGQVRAFLSQLLAGLPPECNEIRESVAWARMIGEVTGIGLGVAMTATITLQGAPTPFELARRHRLLKQMLYVASLLFVVGVLMSRANFAWVLAQWDVPDEQGAKVIESVVTAGVVQSGVGYSALLVAFFAPVRGLLSFHVRSVMPKCCESSSAQRDKWLKDNDLGGTWQDDVRQILAILAPILSAPVLDAVTKL